MKKLFLLPAIGIFLCFESHAQKDMGHEYHDGINKGETLYNKKNYIESASAYSAAFAGMGGKGRERDRYNAARAWSMAGNADSAFDCLQRIAEITYYDDVARLTSEADFNTLHTDSRWQPLVRNVVQNEEGKLPVGWGRAGSKPQSYIMNVDKGAGMSGANAITIKSRERMISGFGTVMQNFLSEKYLGERVRMTGYIKTKDVDDWCGLWLRVDGKKSGHSLAFDNMKNGRADRSIHGTNDWQKYEIVLDVSERAANIAFGVLLSGTGQIWFDKIEFEIVDQRTETTGQDKFREPVNFRSNEF